MGKNPGIFKDIGKSAKDLLTKDYQDKDTKNTAEIKTTAPNGVKYTAKSDPYPGFSSLTANYKYADGIETECELKTDGTAEGSIEFSGLVDGLIVKLAGQSVKPEKDGKGSILVPKEADIHYKQEAFTSNLKYDFKKGTGVAAGVVGFQGLTLGLQADGLNNKGVGKDGKPVSAVASYAAALSFKQPEFTLTAIATQDVSGDKPSLKWEGTCIYNVSKEMDVAAKIDNKMLLTVGGAYKLDKATTAKAKVTSTGIIGLAYKQVLNPTATLTLSGKVETEKMQATKSGVGIALALSA